VSKKEVTRNTTNLIVKRTVRTLGHGRQFGFEEMMKCWRDRVFQARVVGSRRVEVIFLSKRQFLRQLNEKDTKAYEKLCEHYSDIMKDG